MTVFEAYITNLGKYAEGQLVGETLKFPATTEEVQSLLKNIGVDGVLYEEFFITAFDGDVMGLGAFTKRAMIDQIIRRRSCHNSEHSLFDKLLHPQRDPRISDAKLIFAQDIPN